MELSVQLHYKVKVNPVVKITQLNLSPFLSEKPGSVGATANL